MCNYRIHRDKFQCQMRAPNASKITGEKDPVRQSSICPTKAICVTSRGTSTYVQIPQTHSVYTKSSGKIRIYRYNVQGRRRRPPPTYGALNVILPEIWFYLFFPGTSLLGTQFPSETAERGYLPSWHLIVCN